MSDTTPLVRQTMNLVGRMTNDELAQLEEQIRPKLNDMKEAQLQAEFPEQFQPQGKIVESTGEPG